MLTEASGQVGIEVQRDRDGTFEPQIMPKRHRNYLTVLRAALGCITPDGGFVSKERSGKVDDGSLVPGGFLLNVCIAHKVQAGCPGDAQP